MACINVQMKMFIFQCRPGVCVCMNALASVCVFVTACGYSGLHTDKHAYLNNSDDAFMCVKACKLTCSYIDMYICMCVKRKPFA